MTQNFTREHKLVEDISSKGWFASPAGRQGYEVIILEQVGDSGSRFYASLKPGETLRFSERIFGKFTALAVDVRHARGFPVEGKFNAYERGRSVHLRAKVRYRVTDARVVAMETLDPLGELRDKVTATLNRELARHREATITPGMIEQIIRSVGPAPHLGLTVEDAEILEFTADTRLTDQVIEQEDLQHKIAVGDRRSRAEIEAQERKQSAEIRWKQEKHSAIDLSDINTLMHEYPDIIPNVFSTFAARDQRLLEAQMSAVGPAIAAYIQQQQEDGLPINPEEIAAMMRRAIAPSAGRLQSPVDRKQIVWGDDVIKSLPAGKADIAFGDDDAGERKKGKKPSGDNPRIKFG